MTMEIEDQTFPVHASDLESTGKHFEKKLNGKYVLSQRERISMQELNSDGIRSPEESVRSRKREHCGSNPDSSAPKKARNISQSDDKLCELSQADQNRNHFHYRLIGLMYQLDLMVLCSLRKDTYGSKYPSLSLEFKYSESAGFNNIVRYNKRLTLIQIENVDQYYVDNVINYARLFTKEKRSLSINTYLDNFVKHLISESDSLLNHIEYIVIYTNSGLDLTPEKKLKLMRSKTFYPFKFDRMNIEECDILKDLLFTNDDTAERGFYQFSRDKETREELLNRLEFSPVLQQERLITPKFGKEIKGKFIDKLVFAVNQPNREELNRIIKTEIEKTGQVQYDYTALQKERLYDLAGHKKHGKAVKHISGIIYEFNLLMFFLHDMFLHKNISSINFSISNNIVINYEDNVSFIKVYSADRNIGYSQLFPSRQKDEKSTPTINKYFRIFVEKLKQNINYFIIYTNANLDLTEESKLKENRCKDFYPFKFDSLDIHKEKYKFLRDCSCINGNGLYRFAREEITGGKLLNLLKLPRSLQKEKYEGRLFNENERKQKFLNKLILAVNQPNTEELNWILRNKIDKSDKVPYNYEELREIALRWSESHEFGPIKRVVMKKLFEDIQNKRSSYQKIQDNYINEEIRFAKSVVGKESTPVFNQFLDFLIRGEGKKCLEVLNKRGINPINMSSILHVARADAIKSFKDLYDLWFDAEGNITQYLKTLKKAGINLANMSSILGGSGVNAAKSFRDLYNIWFDAEGNETQYLKTLDYNEISLTNMSSIVSGAGVNAAKAFQDLYNLWFDEDGNKTQYLRTLDEQGIKLTNICNILNVAGSHAAKAFKELYDLLFDKEGNKTQYLKTLENIGIYIPYISKLLHGSGAKAPRAFRNLYYLWSNVETHCLTNSEENRIDLTKMKLEIMP